MGSSPHAQARKLLRVDTRTAAEQEHTHGHQMVQRHALALMVAVTSREAAPALGLALMAALALLPPADLEATALEVAMAPPVAA